MVPRFCGAACLQFRWNRDVCIGGSEAKKIKGTKFLFSKSQKRIREYKRFYKEISTREDLSGSEKSYNIENEPHKILN